jgi:hypothetical protein
LLDLPHHVAQPHIRADHGNPDVARLHARPHARPRILCSSSWARSRAATTEIASVLVSASS